MPQGFRVVSFSLQDLTAKTLEFRHTVDLRIGSEHTSPGGLYLGSDLDFLQYYLGGTDNKDLILTLDYDEADFVCGQASGSNERRVSKAVLASVRFEDENLQEKFGHLLDPAVNEQRRKRDRGQCVAETEPGRRVSLIRAMSAEVKHLFPMDYAYKVDTRSLPALAKKVLHAYEEGDQLRTSAERMLRMTLDHAVTTAIYEEDPQRVTFALVPTTSIFKASNEGEYFYDANTPQPVVTLFEVDANGSVSLSAPSMIHERDESLSL